jgi:malate dehydrogenase (oxaloacetate-decarboxylating)(NADP+)
MKPVYERARGDRQRVVYAEGEEETVLRAVQTSSTKNWRIRSSSAAPTSSTRASSASACACAGRDFELTNINDDPRFNEYWQQYHALTERRGVTPAAAKNLLRSRPTLIAALMVERGEADAMICGLVGRFHKKLGLHAQRVRPGPGREQAPSAMTGVINEQGVWFFLDTHVQLDPSAEQIAECTLQATYRPQAVRHRAQGRAAVAFQLRQPRRCERAQDAPGARDPQGAHAQAGGGRRNDGRHRVGRGTAHAHLPNTTLKGRANLYVMPNLDAANITYNMVRVMTDGVAIGPILMGLDQPAHILTPGLDAAPRGQHDRHRRGGGADQEAAAEQLRPRGLAALVGAASAASCSRIPDDANAERFS